MWDWSFENPPVSIKECSFLNLHHLQRWERGFSTLRQISGPETTFQWMKRTQWISRLSIGRRCSLSKSHIIVMPKYIDAAWILHKHVEVSGKAEFFRRAKVPMVKIELFHRNGDLVGIPQCHWLKFIRGRYSSAPRGDRDGIYHEENSSNGITLNVQWSSMSNILYDECISGRHEEASQQFLEAVALEPTNTIAMVNAAETMTQLKVDEKAEHLYRKWVEYISFRFTTYQNSWVSLSVWANSTGDRVRGVEISFPVWRLCWTLQNLQCRNFGVISFTLVPLRTPK